MLSDVKAVSLEYEVKKFNCDNKEDIVDKYGKGEIAGEVGLDPGDKTWLAWVYRDVETNKEVNCFKLF